MYNFLLQEVFGDENIETFQTKFELVSLQRERLALPPPDSDTHKSKDTKSSDSEEPLPKESDIEKLQESLRQREEREATLQRALEVAKTEIQNYRADLVAVKNELHTANSKIRELELKVLGNNERMHKVQAIVSQHSSELEMTPQLIDEASIKLKIKLKEEERKRLSLQASMASQLGKVQLDIKSDIKSDIESAKVEVESKVTSQVETQIKAQIPEVQSLWYMKEELEKTMQQLRDEMEKKMYEMERKMSDKFEEREEVC